MFRTQIAKNDLVALTGAELLEQIGECRLRDAIGDADNELIFIVGIHIRQCKKLIVNAKDTSRTFDDDFAVGGEPRTAARHVEYFPDQNLLQAFYVQTDGRLTQAEFSRCLGVGSGLCDRDGSTQKFNRNVSSFMSTVHMLAPPESRVIDLAISLTKGLSARANRGRNIDGARDNFFTCSAGSGLKSAPRC